MRSRITGYVGEFKKQFSLLAGVFLWYEILLLILFNM